MDRSDQPRAHQPRDRADDARRGLPLPRAAVARRHGALAATASTAAFGSLLGGSLAFYATALYLGFHEGHLVVAAGLTPEQAEAATALHPFLIMGAGIAMLAGFWTLLWLVARSMWRSPSPVRPLVLAGCGALAVGTLQGPVQAFPAVNELLDRSGDAGDVIVNLHAQLNMLAGLMPVLLALALALMRRQSGEPWPRGHVRVAAVGIASGMGVYYAAGIAFAAVGRPSRRPAARASEARWLRWSHGPRWCSCPPRSPSAWASAPTRRRRGV